MKENSIDLHLEDVVVYLGKGRNAVDSVSEGECAETSVLSKDNNTYIIAVNLLFDPFPLV